MHLLELSWLQIFYFSAAIAVAGAFSGFLAGLFGIGGGAVLVLAFYETFQILDVPESVQMHLAVGSSLAIIVPTSIRSTLAHKSRGAVDMDLLRSFLIAIPAGSVAAALVAAIITSEGLRIIFALLTFVTGLRLLFNRSDWRIGTTIPPNPVRALVGIGIGFLSTLMGIGGGILNNTFMTLYGRPIHQAVATSAGVGVLIAIPGTIGYVWAGFGHPDLPFASTGYVNWLAVALVVPISWMVAPYGVRLAHWLKRRQLEVGFGAFSIFIALRFLISLL